MVLREYSQWGEEDERESACQQRENGLDPQIGSHSWNKGIESLYCICVAVFFVNAGSVYACIHTLDMTNVRQHIY